mgnify:CR=1 FL=1
MQTGVNSTEARRHSIADHAAILTVSKITVLLISMVSAMLLSRFRTLEEYGTYSQIMLVVNIITPMIMLGFPKSINYFLSRTDTKEEDQRFISTYYTYNTLLSIVVGIALILSTPLITKYFSNENIRNYTYILAVYPWTKIIMSSIENILIVYGQVAAVFKFRIANSICLLAIIPIVQFLNLGFQAYMAFFVAIEVVFTVIVYFIAHRLSGGLTFLLDTSLIKNILKFSIPLGLASVVGTLNIELDKLMIGKFLDTEGMAIYTNASREMPVTIISSSLTAVLLPRIAKLLKDNENEHAVKLWGRATLLSYMIICFLACALFVFAPEFMIVLYSDKYLPGVPVFRVYSIVLLLRCTYFGMILNAKGKTKFIFYSSIISLCLNAILNYALYIFIGAVGLAVATFLSQLIINLTQLFFAAKCLEIKFRKIFPWRELGITSLINMLLAIIFYYVKTRAGFEAFVGEVPESILLGMLWVAIYIAIIYKKVKTNWVVLNEGE